MHYAVDIIYLPGLALLSFLREAPMLILLIAGWLLALYSIFRLLRIRRKEKEFSHEELYRLMVDNIKDYAIFIVDPEGKVLSWNKGAEAIKGYQAEEIIGKNVELFYSEEDRLWGLPKKNLESARKLGHFESEGWRYRKDGSKFMADVLLTPLFSQQGVLKGFAKVTRDITERSRTELELKKMNDEMAAFTYSVSHDLRAPLRSIVGFARILETEYGAHLDKEALRLTSIIKASALRMGKLIDDLLAFSKTSRQELQMATIDTNLMVEAIMLENNHALPARNPIIWKKEHLHPTIADQAMIKIVWSNLISNAVKYSARTPQPIIEIGSYLEGESAIYFVRDNGVGFDEQYKNKLFQVFHRLHHRDEFEGTGVGLALVEKIVSRHLGRVWAEGKPGLGACFYFSLPFKTDEAG